MGKKKTGSTRREAKKAHRPGRAPSTPERERNKRAGKVVGTTDASKKPASRRAGGLEGSRKTTRHLEALLVLERIERASFFDTTPPERILEIFEESYAADLVNLLLDLKKAAVKNLFEILARLKKRAIVEAATLFYYKEYLTNPLPLRVETDKGLSLPNFYAILGVPRDASEEELKTAHRLLARAHGDAFFSPAMREAAAERLKEIDEAFQNLASPAKRARADKLLPNVHYLYPRRDQSWLEALNRVLG